MAATPSDPPPRQTLGTFTAGKAVTHKCSGTCGLRLPLKRFPTTKTAGVRVGECRSCRDARTKPKTATTKTKDTK